MPINADGKFIANFDDGVPSEFSGITTTESVQDFNGLGTGTNVFSGNFLRNTTPTYSTSNSDDPNQPGLKTTLTLENLPSHTSIDLNFLLGIIDTWDGKGDGTDDDFIDNNSSDTQRRSDFFNITVDGKEIFKKSFSTFDSNAQDYVPPAGVELVTFDSQNLFTDEDGVQKTQNDSAYDMGLDPTFDSIEHTADTLTIEWFSDGPGWQGDRNGVRDESWAIDNVEVILNGLDTTAPSVDTSNGLSPADDSDDVAAGSNLVITFDEPVKAGSGNIIITDADGNAIEIDVTSDAVSIDGNTVTINPPADLESFTDYNVTIASGVIQDLSGNAFAGISNPTIWNFTTEKTTELQVNDDGLFSISGSGTANLKAQFVSKDATFTNEVGVFAVNDDQGTIVDPDTNESLTPDDGDAYIQAALKQSQILLSSLSSNPNDFDPTELSRTVEGFSGGDRMVFYLVSDSTTDAVLNGETSAEQVILGATFDSDAFEPLRITSESNGKFNLSWEDQVGGGDESFDDVVLSVQLTDEPIARGTQLQGGSPGELIDLTGESGLVDFNYTVHREAVCNNEVYFYEIDNADGLMGSFDPNSASQADYLQAALDNVVRDAITGEVIKMTADDGATQTGSATIEAGSILAPMMILNGTLDQFTDADTSNDPEVYFPYMGANSTGFDHMNLLGDNTFGFEDMGSNGDKDYNDLIVKIDFPTIGLA